MKLKRIYHITMLLAVMLAIVSCEPASNDRTVYERVSEPTTPSGQARVTKYVFDEVHSDFTQQYDVHHFVYHGHSYIVFEQGSSESLRIAAVHDPDCKCMAHQHDQLSAIIAKQDSIGKRIGKIEKGLNSQYQSNSALSKEVTGLRRTLNKVSFKLDSIR